MSVKLTIVFLAVILSWTVTDEIELLGAGLIAGFCFLLGVCFAPLLLKVLILLSLLLNKSSYFAVK